jgi:hypothetical protein
MSAERAFELLKSGQLLNGYQESLLDGIFIATASFRRFLDEVEGKGVTTVTTAQVRELVDTLDLELKETQ